MPFPANYGGVIDVYYKLWWLKRAGVKIHLHCFAYGRRPAPELEKLCEKVYYYPRKTGFLSNLSLLPYTVKSRQSAELEKNLLSNDYPILFEVLHTCYLLNDERFRARKKIYRHSNIEHEYYMELARSERSPVKKLFLKTEAFKLKRFEKILSAADLILAVNQKDTAYFKQNYPAVGSVYLPSFHTNEAVSGKEGRGDYILFHGNLGISENYEAAAWLIDHVFSKTSHRVIIAGLNPPGFLTEKCRNISNIKLEANPEADRMDALIREAHVHALYTAQPTGLKLKLLNVLFAGRFVVLNDNMISGTGLTEGHSMAVADSPAVYVQNINDFFTLDFSEEDIKERAQQVAAFDNKLNADRLIREVF